jgi:hypothetical protein
MPVSAYPAIEPLRAASFCRALTIFHPRRAGGALRDILQQDPSGVPWFERAS